LAVQRLQVNQRVLVLGNVVGQQNGDRWFSTMEVSNLAMALRIPAGANVTNTLSRFAAQDWVLKRRGARPWSLTPLGRERAEELIGNVDYSQIEAELVGTPGVEFATARHTVIPPSFAPARWQPGITRLLNQFPFETNVFCMTRFPSTERADLTDPVATVISVLRDVVAKHGLHLHLASDRQTEDALFDNVGAHMWACQYGIGLLENRGRNGTGLNSNTLIELGSMLVTGRRCAILKDRGAPSPPSDLSGQIYKSVELDDSSSVSTATHQWLSHDLSLGRCPECPTL
jgi:hypothetical protein